MDNEKQTKEQLLSEQAKSENKVNQAKDAQPLSNKFYETIFENTKIAIAVFGEDNIILLANEEFEKLAGYTREEIEGRKKWTEFVARKNELERMEKNHCLRLIDPLSVPEKYEFQFIDRKGETKNILLTATLLPGTKQTLAELLDITDRKRVEADLVESKRRLADIIEFLPDPTYAIDLSGTVIAWNRAMEEMTGVKAEDILGKGDYEYAMLLRGIRQPVLINQAMGVAIADEGNYDFVKREGDVLTAEAEITLRGKSLTLWGKAAPLRDSHGNIVGAIESFHDVTELKQAEKSLQKSEAILRSVFETNPVGLCIMKDRIFQSVNKTWIEICGYSESELIGHTPRLLYEEEEEYERVGAELFTNLAQRGLASVLTKLRRKDSDIRDVILTAAPLHLDDISLRMALVTIEDLTERKRAEEALNNIRKLQTVILDNSTVGIAFIRNRIHVWVNLKLCELFGIPKEKLEGASTRIFYPDDESYKSQGNEIYSLFSQGKKVSIEAHMRKGDGSLFWSRREGIALDAANPDDGSIWIVEDITERKRAEEALEKRIIALTKPLDDTQNIDFEDLFNLSDLQRLQDMLADSWGVAVLLTRPDGTPITQPSNFTYFCEFIRNSEIGRRNCQISDAELGRYNPFCPIIHKCLSAGLWGAGASITVGGRHIANWLIGQVRNEAQSEEEIMEYACKIGVDETVFRKAFLEVPVMSQEKFEQIAHALFALANQLSGIAYQNIQQARFIADRKQAEEALRESEERFNLSMEATNDGLWDWNIKTDTGYFSPGYYRMLGYEADAFPAKGSTWEELIHPNDLEHAIQANMACIEGRIEHFEVEYRMKARNGEWRWILGRGKCVARDEEGHALRLVGTHVDITDRKRAEEALRESEEKFKGIFEKSPIGIALYDREGTLLDLNRACLDIFGIINAKTLKKINLFENPGIKEEFKAKLRRGENVRLEMPYDFEKATSGNLYETTKRGIIYLDVLITPLRDIIKASDIGYLVHTLNITKRRKAEEALRESERKYRHLHESMTEAFAKVDMKGHIREANRAFQEMLGYSGEELCQLTYKDITPEKWHDFERRIIEEQVLREGHSEVYEKEYRRKNGVVFPVEVRTFLVQDDSNKQVSI
ncbi:MAG: PAS domain S-box protein, partial [Smithella sp.]